MHNDTQYKGATDHRPFTIDFLRRSGHQYYFGNVPKNDANPAIRRLLTNLSWIAAGVCLVGAIAGSLFAWPSQLIVILGALLLVCVGGAYISERLHTATTEAIIIDTKRQVVIFPPRMEMHGAHPMDTITVRVQSPREDEAAHVITRDWWVVLEGVLEKRDDHERTFQVHLIGPGYRPQMADEAHELRKLGQWENVRG